MLRLARVFRTYELAGEFSKAGIRNLLVGRNQFAECGSELARWVRMGPLCWVLL